MYNSLEIPRRFFFFYYRDNRLKSVYFSDSVIKDLDKNQFKGRRGQLWLTIPVYIPLLWDIKATRMLANTDTVTEVIGSSTVTTDMPG